MECLICVKHATPAAVDRVWEDDLVWAGHMPGETTVYRGWLLVETRRHAAGFEDLTDEESAAVGVLISRAARVLRAVTAAEHVYAFRLGDGVPHLHVHLVPRYPATPREYWGLRLDEWPDAPLVDQAGRAELVERLQASMRDGTR